MELKADFVLRSTQRVSQRGVALVAVGGKTKEYVRCEF